MGLANAGSNVGEARGKVTIDTSQAEQAPGKMQGVAQGISNAMSQIGSGTNQAQRGFVGLSQAAQAFSAVFGVSFGAAGIAQLVRMGVALGTAAADAERVRDQYAVLADGIGESADDMLQSMRTASRGMISDNELVLAANKAMLLGVAKNSADMNRLLESSRVLGQAMGQDVSKSFNDVVIGLGRLSPLILDNLGIANEGEQMFENYARSVGRTADSLSRAEKQQVLLNKILTAAAPLLEAEGERTDSQADKTDRLSASWQNYRDQVGKSLNTFTGAPTIIDATSGALEVQTTILQTEVNWWNQYTTAVGNAGKAFEQWLGLAKQAPSAGGQAVPAWMTGVSKAASGPLLSEEQVQRNKDIASTKLDWGKGISDLNQRTNDELLDQNESYQRQRSDSERDFQQATSRAAEDFALNRTRQEQDLADSIVRLHADAARREQRMAADLARGIAKAQADSEERIADAREDAAERLAELEEDYAKEREKRARDLSDKLLDAAGRLDAKQVYELQRNAAKQEEEAEEAHTDQRDKLQKQLAERLDDERESLAKSIAQQREAYDRQLSDQREADAQRLTDMQAEFEKRRAQEEYDYGVRMGRMAKDHQDQLAEMDRAHGARITQIQTHAAQERAKLDEEHQRELTALGVRNDAWIAEIKRVDAAALEELDRFLHPIRVWAHDPTQPLVVAPDRLAGTSAAPLGAGGSGTSISRSTSMGQIVVNINGTNLNETQLEGAIVKALTKVLEEHTP